jgi:hypothetical protein
MLPHAKLISVAGIVLLAALATPALAGTLYKWTTADGSVAFTDDPKRVPERYRSQIKTIQTGGLDAYERFTPSDGARQSEQQKRLQARLERLRALNAPPQAVAPQMVVTPGPGGESQILIRADRRTALTIPKGTSDGEPVIVEEMRVRNPNAITTRHVTVVRQGDRVLSVIKPASPEQPGSPPSEAEFE